MSITLSALQQQRRDTAANWTSANPTLLAGEWGYETDTGKWKVGDGSTAWTSLAYVAIPDNNGLIPIAQLLLPAGTAAAPSLTFTGDLNTGIYHSAADTLAFSTAGTGRLFINSSGNVGIGTSSPSEELEVVGDIKFGSGSNTWLSSTNVLKSSNSQGAFLRAFVSTAANPTYAQVGDENTGVYFPAADALGVTTGGTERLRIDSSGRVGIGTSSPTDRLTVYNSSASVAITGPSGASKLLMGNQDSAGANTPSLISAANGNLNFGTGSTWTGGGGTLTYSMTVTSAGNVGIGTSSPSAKLHVSSSGDTIVRVTSADGNGAFLDLGDASDPDGGRIVYDSGSNLAFNTASSERLRINSSGNVGIGSSSPQGKLQVYTSSLNSSTQYYGQNFGIVVETENQDALGDEGNGICFTQQYTTDASDSSKVRTGAIIGFKDAASGGFGGGLKFKVQPSGANPLSTSMTLKANGNVGIGTSSPQRVLHVKDSNPSVWVQPDADTETCYYSFVNTSGSIRGYVAYDISTENMFFRTNGAERVRIDGQGRVGIGTSSPGRQLHIAGTNNILRLESTSTVASRIEFENTGSSSSDSVSIGSVNNDMQLVTSGSERMRIDSSGRLLAGNSSSVGNVLPGYGSSTYEPGTQLTGTTYTGNNWLALSTFSTATGPSGSSFITLSKSNNATIGSHTAVNTNQLLGAISFAGSDGTAFRNAAHIYCLSGPTVGTNQMSGQLLFYTNDGGLNSTERMRIDSSGRVGIRTSAPSYALDINSGDANAVRIRGTADNPLIMDATDSGPSYVSVQRAGTRVAYYGFGGSGNDFNIFNDTSTGDITFGTNGTEVARFTDAGRLGLGTTSPSTKLHLVDASSPTILVQDTTNNVQAVFGALDSFAQTGTGTNHDFRFLTNNTERLRIGSAGQIGLSGANYGTSGQVLTSNGSGSAPTWQNAGGSALSTAVTLSSNASVTFTDVPSWAGKIIVMAGDIDTSASQHIRVRLGTSGGVISTGYVQSTHNDSGGGANSSIDGFYWFNNATNSGFSGLMTITKLSSTEYCQAHTGRFDNTGGNHGGGYLSGISGTIDRVEISIISGTMTSGRINLRYEP